MSTYSLRITVSGNSGSVAIISCGDEKEFTVPTTTSISELLNLVGTTHAPISRDGNNRKRKSKSSDPPKNLGRRWSESQELTLTSLLKEQTDVATIADKLGRSRLGILCRIRSIFSGLIEKDGWTPERIRSEFNVTPEAYDKWMKKVWNKTPSTSGVTPALGPPGLESADGPVA